MEVQPEGFVERARRNLEDAPVVIAGTFHIPARGVDQDVRGPPVIQEFVASPAERLFVQHVRLQREVFTDLVRLGRHPSDPRSLRRVNVRPPLVRSPAPLCELALDGIAHLGKVPERVLEVDLAQHFVRKADAVDVVAAVARRTAGGADLRRMKEVLVEGLQKPPVRRPEVVDRAAPVAVGAEYDIICRELSYNVFRDESRTKMVDVIRGLEARGAEACILGCKEIELLVQKEHVPGFPLLPSAEIHIQTAANVLLGKVALDDVLPDRGAVRITSFVCGGSRAQRPCRSSRGHTVPARLPAKVEHLADPTVCNRPPFLGYSSLEGLRDRRSTGSSTTASARRSGGCSWVRNTPAGSSTRPRLSSARRSPTTWRAPSREVRKWWARSRTGQPADRDAGREPPCRRCHTSVSVLRRRYPETGG